MEHRQLGGSGFKAPVLSLGTGTFGGGSEFFRAWGASDVAEATRLVEGSLRRLGTEWIDLYQLHGFDALTPVEEVLRTLDDLVRAGKIRDIGIKGALPNATHRRCKV